MIVRVAIDDLDDFLYDDLELIVNGTTETGERIAFHPTRQLLDEVRRSGAAQTNVSQAELYRSEKYGGLYPCPGHAAALEAWAAKYGHDEW